MFCRTVGHGSLCEDGRGLVKVIIVYASRVELKGGGRGVVKVIIIIIIMSILFRQRGH